MADNFDRASLEGLERSAELCAIIVSAAYRAPPDGGHGKFALSPKMLQQLVFSVARSGPKVYGAAIAFVPGAARVGTFDGGREGLEEGVRREANGYGVGHTGSKAVQGSTFTEFSLASSERFVGKTIYSPYAFNCSSSSNSDELCSSMDLATAYDYADLSTTWFAEPMRLFEEQKANGLVSYRKSTAKVFPSIWTEPYFDAGAGSINMTTFSVAFGTDAGEFLGVCTIDVAVESLCWTNCSNQPEQLTTLSATMSSAQTLVVKMKKPSSQPATITMNVYATGGHAFNTTYNLSMVWSTGFAPQQREDWSSIYTEQMSLAGHQVRWLLPPSNDSYVDLDAVSKRFTVTKQYPLQLRLDCAGGRPCIADGDTIETVVIIGSAINAQSEIRIMTEVEAVLSCKKTRTGIEGSVEGVHVSSAIRVWLYAIDIDGLPINQTEAEIRLAFGDRNVPMQWSRGSNMYVAAVPAELTLQPGQYDLVMSASNAWGETGPATSCELLRRTITVKEGLSTSWIVAGAGGSAVVVVGGLVILVRKRRAHLQAIMGLLFTEVGPSMIPTLLSCNPGRRRV